MSRSSALFEFHRSDTAIDSVPHRIGVVSSDIPSGVSKRVRRERETDRGHPEIGSGWSPLIGPGRVYPLLGGRI